MDMVQRKRLGKLLDVQYMDYLSDFVACLWSYSVTCGYCLLSLFVWPLYQALRLVYSIQRKMLDQKKR